MALATDDVIRYQLRTDGDSIMSTEAKPVTLDHMVVLVLNLKAAATQWQAAGFRVRAGGQHRIGSRNALIVLHDGTYIELIQILSRSRRMRLGLMHKLGLLNRAIKEWNPFEQHFIKLGLKEPGLVDFAVSGQSIVTILTRLRAADIKYLGPAKGTRKQKDGNVIRWQCGMPAASKLPFLCIDETDRCLRVPSVSVNEHKNGAQSISRLVVLVENLKKSRKQYEVLLEQSGRDVEVFQDAGCVEFSLGECSLVLTQPKGRQTRLGRQLLKNGEGPLEITIRGARAGLAAHQLGEFLRFE